MSKERLDKAKDVIENMLNFVENVSVLDESDRVLVNDLIEQAERVPVLRKANRELVELGEYILKNFRSDIDGTTTETAQKVMDRMHEQNKRYREVIEKIKEFNRKSSMFGSYTQRDALSDIRFEIGMLEGNPHEDS